MWKLLFWYDTQAGYGGFVVSYFEKLFKDTQKDTVTLLLMLKIVDAVWSVFFLIRGKLWSAISIINMGTETQQNFMYLQWNCSSAT